ncbi:MAG: MFS transporter [Fimbriimonadaceae bacterium]
MASFLNQKVLKNQSFRDLWLGQSISQLGDSMYYMVFLFMADHVSKNPMVVGFVGALAAIPYVIFGPFAGVLVDRADRRKLMLGADVASGLITAALAIYAFFAPSPAVWVLYVAAFLMSSVNTVFFPARSASIPRLVPADQVVEANGVSEATRQLVSIMGLAVSAAGLGALYKIWPDYFFFAGVIANSLTFFASAWFIRRLPSILPLKEEVADENLNPMSRVLEDMKVGLKAVRQDPIIRLALPMNMVSTLAVAGFFVVYLALNRAWYGGEYGTLAAIELCFSVPMLFMSLWVGKQVVIHPGRWTMVGYIGLGVTVGLMAICKPFWSMLLMNALCALFLPLLIIPLQSYLQLAVVDEVRGRVNSTWSMVSQAMNPIGVVVIGVLLKAIGIEGCLWVMGGLFIGAGLLGYLCKAFMNAQMPVMDDQAA